MSSRKKPLKDTYDAVDDYEAEQSRSKRTKPAPGPKVQQLLEQNEHQTDRIAAQGLMDFKQNGISPSYFTGQSRYPSSALVSQSSSSTRETLWNQLRIQSALFQAYPRHETMVETMRGRGSQQLGDRFTMEDRLLNVIRQQRLRQEVLQAYQRLIQAPTVRPPVLLESALLPMNPYGADLRELLARNSSLNLQQYASPLVATEAQPSRRTPPPPVAAASVLHLQGEPSQEPQVEAAATPQEGTITGSVPEVPKPRRPLTAFNLFFKEERLKLKKEFASLSFGFMGQEISRRWKSLQDRQKYCDMALAEKERYTKEMAAYKRSVQVALTKTFDEQRKRVSESAYQEYLDRVQDYEPPPRQRRKTGSKTTK